MSRCALGDHAARELTCTAHALQRICVRQLRQLILQKCAGQDFASELAGAIVRRQDSQRRLPVAIAAAAAPRLAASFSTSAQELLRVRAALRSNPGTSVPTPSPSPKQHPAADSQSDSGSGEWDPSPTNDALDRVGPAAAVCTAASQHVSGHEPVLQNIAVLPKVRPQGVQQMSQHQMLPNQQTIASAERSAWHAACAPQASPQAVPIEGGVQQVEPQQLAPEGANEQSSSLQRTITDAQRSACSPLPTPLPMFDAPARAGLSADAVAEAVAEAAAEQRAAVEKRLSAPIPPQAVTQSAEQARAAEPASARPAPVLVAAARSQPVQCHQGGCQGQALVRFNCVTSARTLQAACTDAVSTIKSFDIRTAPSVGAVSH